LNAAVGSGGGATTTAAGGAEVDVSARALLSPGHNFCARTSLT
jgi:hypothetical protein